jgi:hypothetical protein
MERERGRLVTRLTEALDRVASVVEVRAAREHAEEFSRPLARGHQDTPRPLAASTLMLSIPGIAGIMREQFADVPADRVAAGDDRSVTVTCSCSRELNLGFGQLERCGGCWRFYFNGKTVHGSEPPAPTDVVLCDQCDDELVFKDGAWIRVTGEDLFVCASCHGHLVASADVDLFGGQA